jgi:hypothetical protein
MPWTNDPLGGLSAVPDNGGSGFQPWTSYEAGPFITSFTGQNLTTFADLSVVRISDSQYFTSIPYYTAGNTYQGLSSIDGSCFGIYSPGKGNIATVYRKLISPISTGGYIQFKIGINLLNGEKGIYLISNGERIYGFRARDGHYEYFDGTDYNIINSLTFQPDSVFSVYSESVRIGPSYKAICYVTRPQYNGTTFFADHIPDLIPDEIEIYVTGTDLTPVYDNTLYFNLLTGYSAYR